MHIPPEAHCSCSRVDTSCAVTGYIVRRGALICTASGVQVCIIDHTCMVASVNNLSHTSLEAFLQEFGVSVPVCLCRNNNLNLHYRVSLHICVVFSHVLVINDYMLMA